MTTLTLSDIGDLTAARAVLDRILIPTAVSRSVRQDSQLTPALPYIVGVGVFYSQSADGFPSPCSPVSRTPRVLVIPHRMAARGESFAGGK